MSANLLNFQKIQKSFSDHLRTQETQPELSGVEDRRLKIYRDLFFNNIESFISGTFPVLRELLSEPQWMDLVRDFFVKHACQTPYFLQISEEFLTYLETSSLDFLPDYAYQLAHWEWMELFADVAQTQDVSHILCNIELSDKLSSNDCTWAVAYDFPVQKISFDYLPEGLEATFLIVHRDSDLSVGFIEINPLSMLLFEHLKNNEANSVKDILLDISSQQNIDPDVIIPGGLEIIKQWGLLGLLKPLT